MIVLRYGSLYRLWSFVVDILNQEMDEKFGNYTTSGAFLLVENGQLLHVKLPKEGLM